MLLWNFRSKEQISADLFVNHFSCTYSHGRKLTFLHSVDNMFCVALLKFQQNAFNRTNVRASRKNNLSYVIYVLFWCGIFITNTYTFWNFFANHFSCTYNHGRKLKFPHNADNMCCVAVFKFQLATHFSTYSFACTFILKFAFFRGHELSVFRPSVSTLPIELSWWNFYTDYNMSMLILCVKINYLRQIEEKWEYYLSGKTSSYSKCNSNLHTVPGKPTNIPKLDLTMLSASLLAFCLT